MSVKQGVTLDFMSAETFLPVQDLVLNKLDRPQERLLHQTEHDYYECQQVDGDEDGDQCGEETVMRLVAVLFILSDGFFRKYANKYIRTTVELSEFLNLLCWMMKIPGTVTEGIVR